jgi:hypothetical protein
MSVRRLFVVVVASTLALAGLVASPLSASAATPGSSATATPAVAPDAALTASPAQLNFPDTYAEEDSAPLTVTMTSTGTDPLVIYGPVTFEPNDYDNGDAARITASTCDGATLAPGAHCTVTVVAHPETIGYTDGWLQFHNNSAVAYLKVIVTVTSLETTTGLYYPLAPHRILDTRTGVGTSKHPVLGGSTVALQVLGQSGLPPAGVSAVVLNLTVTHPTTGGHITVFPSGTTRPGVSSINYPKGWTGANLVTVPVGANGKVDLYNSAGSVDLIADVTGWYAATLTVDAAFGDGFGFQPFDAKRVLDTRHTGARQPVAANQLINVVVPIRDYVDADQVHAVSVTVTGVKANTGGYLSAGAVGTDLTKTSTLNLRAGATTSNLANVTTEPCTPSLCPGIAPTSKAVVFSLYNGSASAVDVLVDLHGRYSLGVYAPYRFYPTTPTRIVDTRKHLGSAPLGPKTTRTVTVPASLSSYKTSALVANVTAVDPTSNTVIALGAPSVPIGSPTTSILNPNAGTVVATGASVDVGSETCTCKGFSIYNSAGTTNILVDVMGRFDFFQPDDPII